MNTLKLDMKQTQHSNHEAKTTNNSLEALFKYLSVMQYDNEFRDIGLELFISQGQQDAKSDAAVSVGQHPCYVTKIKQGEYSEYYAYALAVMFATLNNHEEFSDAFKKMFGNENSDWSELIRLKIKKALDYAKLKTSNMPSFPSPVFADFSDITPNIKELIKYFKDKAESKSSHQEVDSRFLLSIKNRSPIKIFYRIADGVEYVAIRSSFRLTRESELITFVESMNLQSQTIKEHKETLGENKVSSVSQDANRLQFKWIDPHRAELEKIFLNIKEDVLSEYQPVLEDNQEQEALKEQLCCLAARGTLQGVIAFFQDNPGFDINFRGHFFFVTSLLVAKIFNNVEVVQELEKRGIKLINLPEQMTVLEYISSWMEVLNPVDPDEDWPGWNESQLKWMAKVLEIILHDCFQHESSLDIKMLFKHLCFQAIQNNLPLLNCIRLLINRVAFDLVKLYDVIFEALNSKYAKIGKYSEETIEYLFATVPALSEPMSEHFLKMLQSAELLKDNNVLLFETDLKKYKLLQFIAQYFPYLADKIIDRQMKEYKTYLKQELLHFLVLSGSVKNIPHFLSAGADPFAKDRWGKSTFHSLSDSTPFHTNKLEKWQQWLNYLTCWNYLCVNYNFIQEQTNNKNTVLHIAAHKGAYELIHLLRESKQDFNPKVINAVADNGNTALHNVFNFLIPDNVDLDELGAKGAYVEKMKRCLQRMVPTISSLLNFSNIDINIKNKLRSTPLEYLIGLLFTNLQHLSTNDVDINDIINPMLENISFVIKLFVDRGAKVNVVCFLEDVVEFSRTCDWSSKSYYQVMDQILCVLIYFNVINFNDSFSFINGVDHSLSDLKNTYSILLLSHSSIELAKNEAIPDDMKETINRLRNMPQNKEICKHFAISTQSDPLLCSLAFSLESALSPLLWQQLFIDLTKNEKTYQTMLMLAEKMKDIPKYKAMRNVIFQNYFNDVAFNIGISHASRKGFFSKIPFDIVNDILQLVGAGSNKTPKEIDKKAESIFTTVQRKYM